MVILYSPQMRSRNNNNKNKTKNSKTQLHPRSSLFIRPPPGNATQLKWKKKWFSLFFSRHFSFSFLSACRWRWRDGMASKKGERAHDGTIEKIWLPVFQHSLVVPLDWLKLVSMANEHLYCCPYSVSKRKCNSMNEMLLLKIRFCSFLSVPSLRATSMNDWMHN